VGLNYGRASRDPVTYILTDSSTGYPRHGGGAWALSRSLATGSAVPPIRHIGEQAVERAARAAVRGREFRYKSGDQPEQCSLSRPSPAFFRALRLANQQTAARSDRELATRGSQPVLQSRQDVSEHDCFESPPFARCCLTQLGIVCRSLDGCKRPRPLEASAGVMDPAIEVEGDANGRSKVRA
jgi:hypothetical protein